MNDAERPPLRPTAYDLIELALHKIETDFWRELAGFQVGRESERPKSPHPPKIPRLLLNRLQVYAGNLFKAEAEQYEQFRKEHNYAPWLGKLEERVIGRVFETIRGVETANAPATLAYHGLTDDEIQRGLGQFLFGVRNYYIWKDAGPHPQPHSIQNEAKPTPNAPPDPALPLESVRRSLVESYRNAFPESGIMDICWAARQHYREWTRWLKGELKDNSKPDRSFRHVLTSGKDAKQLRREIRPKSWK